MFNHYDVPAIERQIRAMYARAQPSDFNDDPAIAECVRRSVEIAVATSNFMFSEMSNGVPPAVLIAALETAVVNVIVNSLQSFNHKEDDGCMLCDFLKGVNGDAHNAWDKHKNGEHSGNGFEVSPVTSGRA